MIRSPDLLQWTSGHGLRFTHDLFRFPGKFHPPMVEQILRSLKPSGVIDPMAGVGTVAVEAKAAGIPSLSLDIDPISAFFIGVKTTPIATATLQAAWEDLSGKIESFRRSGEEVELRKFQDIRKCDMRSHLARVQADDLKRLTYWFRKYVLVDYARIDHSISNGGLPGRSGKVRQFFWACLISSIRRISLADPSPVSGLEITKHMRERISSGYPIDVFYEFERRVELAIRRMGEYTKYLRENETEDTPTHRVQADSIDLIAVKHPPQFHADLILFSPPYCNAIEYWRRHRLEYLLGRFLEEDGIVALSKKFIGRTSTGCVAAPPSQLGFRPIDNLIRILTHEDRVHKARVLWQYFESMKKRLEVFYNYLPRRGHCIVVVGDSTTGGKKVPTVKTLTWLAQATGFNLVNLYHYKIKNRVMQFPIKTNLKIEKESIIVLQKY